MRVVFKKNVRFVFCILLLLIPNHSYSDVFNDIKIYPIEETKISLINFQNTFKSSLALDQLKDFEFQVFFEDYIKYGFRFEHANRDLFEIEDESLNGNNLTLEISVYKDNSLSLLRNWNPTLSLKLDYLKTQNLNCYISEVYIIQNNISNCSSLDKTVIKTNDSLPLSIISGTSSSIELGLSKTNYFWSSKSTFFIGLNNSFSNIKTEKNINYKSLLKTNEDYFFSQANSIISQQYFLSYSLTNRLKNNWGLYGQATAFVNKAINYNDKELKNLDKNNYQLEIGFLKKHKALFIGSGINYSKKRYIGYNPLMHNLSSNNIIEKSETKIFTKIGYLLNHKLFNRENSERELNNKYVLEELKTNSYQISRENRFQKKSTLITKVIKPEDQRTLKEYALNYAKIYDNSLKFF